MRWVVGDIHGMLRPLSALVAHVTGKDPTAQFLFVGDYVNRGPDSRGVLDLLLSLQGEGRAKFVRGNHDDIFDMVLSGQSYAYHPDARTPLAAFLWFTHYGLMNTLTSYGIDELDVEWVRKRPTDDAIRKLLTAVPESHRRFIHELPSVLEERDLFVVHAMWDPDEPDDPPMADRLSADLRMRYAALWGRFTYEISRRKRWKRTGYFGHTPVETFRLSIRRGDNVPIHGPQIVLLDTGAALSANGRLSAVSAETGELVQMDRVGEVVETT
jgi:serine/threonine protein phosphatase 1